jgi:hypothetical protein
MKKLLLTIFIVLFFTVPSMADDVQWGISVGIGDPHFYGRISIGSGYPEPVCVYPYPRAMIYDPYYYGMEPIYLRVPPGHMGAWGTYCRYYNACQRRVYFVQDNWYHNHYAPAYRQRHGQGGQPPQYRYGHGQYGGHPYGKPDRHIGGFGKQQPQRQPQAPAGRGGQGKGWR